MHRFIKSQLLVLTTLISLVILAACSKADQLSQSDADQVAKLEDPWLQIQHVDKWTGDSDGMIEHGFIRFLVIHSKSFYSGQPGSIIVAGGFLLCTI